MNLNNVVEINGKIFIFLLLKRYVRDYCIWEMDKMYDVFLIV